MRRFSTLIAAGLALASAAVAQELPSPMKIVVTFPAGGTADVLGRLVADQIGKAGGPSVVVDNRPGANSIIGNEFAARAAPDGGTMLLVANSFLITSFLRKLPYDPIASYEPVCALVDSPLVIAVGASSPFKTLDDLLNAAKAKPGVVSTAAIGPATAQRVAVELLKKSAGVDVNFVPYPSNALAINALLGGEVASVTVNIADIGAMVADGRARILATLSPKRIEGWPNIPTARESGHDVAYAAWFGLVAPAKTPPAVLDKLSALVTKAMEQPDLRARLKPLEFYPSVACGAKFSEFLRGENDATGRIVREAGIKME